MCLEGGGMKSERILANNMEKREDVVKAFHKMMHYMAIMDGMAIKFLKKWDKSVVDWSVRLFSICIAPGEVLEDCHNVREGNTISNIRI